MLWLVAALAIASIWAALKIDAGAIDHDVGHGQGDIELAQAVERVRDQAAGAHLEPGMARLLEHFGGDVDPRDPTWSGLLRLQLSPHA